MLATHDVELAAELAHRVILLAEGEVIADGPAADVITSSPPSPRRSARSSPPSGGSR